MQLLLQQRRKGGLWRMSSCRLLQYLLHYAEHVTRPFTASCQLLLELLSQPGQRGFYLLPATCRSHSMAT